VDDNPNVRSFVEPGLVSAGFRYVAAIDGWDALEKLEAHTPDAVVLDIMLGDPKMTGLDVCRKIRESGSNVPVIFLTVKDRTENPWFMDRAFSLGGDDYMSKREELHRIERQMGLAPTEVMDRKSDLDELIARIKARLPRSGGMQTWSGQLRADLAIEKVELQRDGAWTDAGLTSTEFHILRTLIENVGKPVAKSALLAAAGIDPIEVDVDGALQSHIYRLRRAIEPDTANPQFVVTYHRVGYRFGPGGEAVDP
jgi:DNA-binding response OmpR family regulator